MISQERHELQHVPFDAIAQISTSNARSNFRPVKIRKSNRPQLIFKNDRECHRAQ